MAPPGVRLFNSASRQIEPFVPLVPGQAGIYDCGPTVYDWQTIGNLYRYIVSDVQRRTLEYLGYRVKAVMNITDVGHIVGDLDEGEDKMMLAAKREGRDRSEERRVGREGRPWGSAARRERTGGGA